MDEQKLTELGRAVIRIETAAVEALAGRIDESFVAACKVMLACRGRVVVSGMGKSGHIGNKIAATLASTGTPSIALAGLIGSWSLDPDSVCAFALWLCA